MASPSGSGGGKQEEGSPRGDERAIGASSGMMASSGALSAVTLLLRDFYDLYADRTVQNALTEIKKDVSLMQNDNLPGEDSSGYKFVRERYHGRLWATRPPGPNLIEDQRKILSNLLFKWADLLWPEYEDSASMSDALKRRLTSQKTSEYERNMGKNVLSVFLPLERANALYFMQMIRFDPEVPRGIGWYSRDDVEERRVPENHKVFTAKDVYNDPQQKGAMFPLSRTILKLIEFFDLKDYLAPLLHRIFCGNDYLEKKNRSSEVFYFENADYDLPPLEKHLAVVRNRLDKLGLLKARENQKGAMVKEERPRASGYFGEVFYATWLRTPVAVKKALRGEDDKSRFLLNIETEVMMLHKLRHPNILPLMFVYEEDQDLQIVTDWCFYGSLLEVIKRPVSLNPRNIADVLKQVAAGMAHLHNERIVHCDLSARNVVCKAGSSISRISAQVADMGLAREVNATERKAEAHGPLPNTGIAPEAWRREGFYLGSDVWSFGCLVWQTFSRGRNPLPFDVSLLSKHFEDEIPLGKPIDDCPKEIYMEIRRCTKYEIDDRPSMLDLHDTFDELSRPEGNTFTANASFANAAAAGGVSDVPVMESNGNNSITDALAETASFASAAAAGEYLTDKMEFQAKPLSDVTSNDSASEEDKPSARPPVDNYKTDFVQA